MHEHISFFKNVLRSLLFSNSQLAMFKIQVLVLKSVLEHFLVFLGLVDTFYSL